MDDLPSRHDVGIHVGRVGRLDDQRAVSPVKEIQDIPQLVAGTAGHEDLLRRELHALLCVVGRDGLSEERGPALRHVAVEGLPAGLVVHGPVKRLDDRGAQGQGHVPDAHAVHFGAGMLLLVFLHLLGDIVKQIGVLKLRVVFVGHCHRFTSPSYTNSAGPVINTVLSGWIRMARVPPSSCT